MAALLNRAISLVIALLYLVAAYKHGGGETTLRLAMGLLLPLACIWFPEPLGNYRVCAGGWLVLVGAPLIVFVLTKAN